MEHSENFTTVSTLLDSAPDQPRYEEYFSLGWLLFLFSIVPFVADIYLIIIIRKFKTLQTEANLLFLKVAWCHLGYIILGDTIYVCISLLSYGVRRGVISFLSNLDYLCLGMVYFLLTFLAVNWYTAQYHPEFHKRHPKVFKRGVLMSFLLLLPESLITSGFSLFDDDLVDLVRYIFKNISFFTCLTALIVLFIKKKRKTVSLTAHKTEYCFTIPWVFFLMCLPMNIDGWFHDTYDQNVTDIVYRTILMVLSDVTFIIFTLAPLVMVVLLAKTNKYFRVAYIRCCKKKAVKTYADENLDDAESGDEERSNRVSFDKDFQSVHF